jgi:hypothetical protein
VSDDESREKPPHGATPAQEPSNPWSAPAEPGPSPSGAGSSPYGNQQHGEQPPGAETWRSTEGTPPPPPYESQGGTPPYAPPPPPYGQIGQPPTYGPPPSYAPPPAYGSAPGYGAPAGYGYAGPRTSTNATVVLACGIGSIVLLFTCGLGFIPAIVALVKAGSARREILESQGRLTGLGMVTAGRITAWCTIGLTILAILAIVLLITLGVAFDSTPGDDGFSALGR